MKPMTKWERIEAALHGAEVDRIPFTFWRHYAVQEWSPRRLAELTLAPGCTIDARSPEANLHAARQAAG